LEKLLKTAYSTLDEKFGEDIVILDLRSISILADYFVICHARNANQTRAMADETVRKLRDEGLSLRRQEGDGNDGWLLLDFGDIIIHIFTEETREYYKLEKIWADAQRVLL
jgi:ribosome-associated protein